VNLHQLVIESAADDPDRPAVYEPYRMLRYGDLDRLADIMAHRLRAHGVGRGDRVVIWSEKSCQALIAMQAVLRLGAAYVPADGSIPARRVAAMVRDCGARVVCAQPTWLPQISAQLGPSFRCVDLTEWSDVRMPPVNEGVAPDDLAYILYTSGSTGQPKGVCISHRNARAFVDWAVAEVGASHQDRFANHASFGFDLSVFDIYGAFAVGGSVHLIPAELAYSPERLVDFLYAEKITIWYSVPSALTLMLRDGGLADRAAPEDLNVVVFAGEPFPIAGVRELSRWTPARLLNFYGPTETNVCTAHKVVPDDLVRERPVPIGRPASGDRVWAERSDGTVAAAGEKGELVVDGPTVMLGYWGGEPQRSPYRTGDIVRVLEDGAFDYVGRRDHMVKIRGHRIELGDVEAVLAAHPGVRDVAAVIVDGGTGPQLSVFVVTEPGQNPGVLGLKRHCAELLPRYMIFDEAHFVADLPRSRNGKVDRPALAMPRQDLADVGVGAA
jgi:amino acid adenylation domain-containing protein